MEEEKMGAHPDESNDQVSIQKENAPWKSIPLLVWGIQK
jgi:hypothetical protein